MWALCELPETAAEVNDREGACRDVIVISSRYQSTREAGMEPPTSLAARLYLLAWDPRRERVVGTTQLGAALRAAALVDLVLRGRLAIDAGRVTMPTRAR